MNPVPAEFEVTLELALDEADDDNHLRQVAAQKLQCAVDSLPTLAIRKRSVDARRGSVKFHVVVGPVLPKDELRGPPLQQVSGERPVIIVGGGPAGIFCAYELARAGVAAIVLDRGQMVQARRHDLAALQKRGELNPESNYCFGEGGAGTYSDGKLYTRSHKRGDTRDVLEILAKHGAPEQILVDARPHIGSNRLPKVVTALRLALLEVGVQFRFGARVTNILYADKAGARHAVGVKLAGGEEILGSAVVLATGHSARDMYDLMVADDILVAAKPFALGVRIEHPQPLINQIQYGKFAGHAKLPAANYRLAHTVDDRGVFSFCMCPGGWIVPASTEVEHLVVNGMSLSRRDSPFANSGLVVAIEPSDWQKAGFSAVTGGLDLQRKIEGAAFVAGGGAMRAPATRVTDFTQKRASSTVPETSYIPGLAPSNVAEVLDSAGLFLSGKIRQALAHFGSNLRGFITEEAVLVATESRTSSPLRIVRDHETLMSPSVRGLFPCAEGAGYAGGIVSAALDGFAVARAYLRSQSSG